MKRLFVLAGILMVMGGAVSAQAMLVDMHDGTIYDTDTQLSWLKDGNAAGTTMTWAQAVAWAAGLNAGSGFAGFTDWRLPATTQPDSSCGSQSDPGGGFPLQGFGYGCAGCEMGHLFYVSLGNTAGSLTKTGPFTNLQTSYWSGTEFAPNTSYAWVFYFSDGYQNIPIKTTNSINVWAVRSGARALPPGTRVGYNSMWLVVTLVSLMVAGGFMLRRRMARA